MELSFGKIIKHESYFRGQLKSSKIEYSVPIVVTNKNEVMSELIKCLQLIIDKETTNVSIEIKADPDTHDFKLLTKKYTIN
jgi:ligand-binding sensor protein